MDRDPSLARPPLSVDRILGQATPAAAPKLAPRARDILARINLCRTVALGHRWYDCQDCEQPVRVYNSCGERHCPTCSGSVRADWLERTAPTLVPNTEYLQLVFTIPATLAELFLDNPRVAYNLLMQTAWRELKRFLERIGIEASALIVLHTWNQRLGHHPHLHVLIPVGGISLDGKRWITIDQHLSLADRRQWINLDVADFRLTEPDRRSGHAGNQIELGQWFRKFMINGIVRLYRRGQLQLPGMKCLLFGDRVLQAWLDRVAPNGYGVFVEPPPSVDASPEHILNYIGRYVTGGPISDWRIVSNENGIVKFMARSIDRAPGEKPQRVPIEVTGVEFVRRWIQHILPKGFVRSRHYGNHANSNRAAYLQQARALLGLAKDKEELLADEPESAEWNPAKDAEEPNAVELDSSVPRCPNCGQTMVKVDFQRRPSWRITMRSKYRPSWYDS